MKLTKKITLGAKQIQKGKYINSWRESNAIKQEEAGAGQNTIFGSEISLVCFHL